MYIEKLMKFIFFLLCRYTVNEAIDLITNESDEENQFSTAQATISIIPPIEDTGAATDCDSEKSDDENEGNIHHLPRRILQAEALIEIQNECEEATTNVGDGDGDHLASACIPPKRRKITNRTWLKRDQCSSLPEPPTVGLSDDVIEKCQTPFDAWKLMLTAKLLSNITEQSNLYAAQLPEAAYPAIQESEVLVYIGICLLSGYAKVPDKEMYWERSADCHNEAVANAIRRDRFRLLHRFVHLADNSRIDDDRFYKVRAFFDVLNSNFKIFKDHAYYAIDEIMVPYFGKHGSKQYMHGKPIRYGYKLWAITSSDGYLIHAEPYCGSSTRITETGHGKSADVVLDLTCKAGVRPGSRLFFDN
jgi:DNA excision repair protein ERCC-6